MKRVFSSNSELCHVWAQQNQSEGRGNNMFFRDSMIFSYGEHYMAGKIHTFKGKKFALVNSIRYSVTTCKHIYNVVDAVNNLMPYFYAPDVTNPRHASKCLDSNAQNSTRDALKRVKVTCERDIQWEFEKIHEAFKKTNELRKILGLAEIGPKKKQLDAVETHLRKRLARYHELNTPEMIAKRAKEAAKRKAKDLAESIAKFRAGQQVWGLNALAYDLIRVDGNEVVTSRGASVPLNAALAMLKGYLAGKDLTGRHIGPYTLNRVEEYTNGDACFVIGCHRIKLSEAKNCY